MSNTLTYAPKGYLALPTDSTIDCTGCAFDNPDEGCDGCPKDSEDILFCAHEAVRTGNRGVIFVPEAYMTLPQLIQEQDALSQQLQKLLKQSKSLKQRMAALARRSE